MKNIQNRINAQLFKQKTVELQSEKVELGTLDDIKSYTKGYQKYYSELQGLQKRGDRLKDELSDVISAIMKWGELGDSMADDMASLLVAFEKAAKQLGLNPSESKDFKDGEAAFKAYAESSAAAQRLSDNYRTVR